MQEQDYSKADCINTMSPWSPHEQIKQEEKEKERERERERERRKGGGGAEI